MRIGFMGTPDFALAILRDLHDWCRDQRHDLVAIYSQPPGRSGRGKKTTPSPVHQYGKANNIPVFTPRSLKRSDEQAAFTALDLDIVIVAAYGLILPKAILGAPTFGCLNVHGSLLPRWRGAAPIQRAIMAGDTKTGVCMMRMEERLDTGPVYRTRTVTIDPGMTAGELHNAMATGNREILVGAIEDAAAGIEPAPQSDEGVTYAKKIEKAESKIDWTRPATEVDYHIRGLSPFPGAWFELGDERIKVLRSAVSVGKGEAGQLIDDDLSVACGDGAIRLLELQRSGKRAVSADAFLRGFVVPAGTRLG